MYIITQCCNSPFFVQNHFGWFMNQNVDFWLEKPGKITFYGYFLQIRVGWMLQISKYQSKFCQKKIFGQKLNLTFDFVFFKSSCCWLSSSQFTWELIERLEKHEKEAITHLTSFLKVHSGKNHQFFWRYSDSNPCLL